MTEKEEMFSYAMAALMGLVSRGASPAEAGEMMWIYAEFAQSRKPVELDE
jgi:hypothetical protein